MVLLKKDYNWLKMDGNRWSLRLVLWCQLDEMNRINIFLTSYIELIRNASHVLCYVDHKNSNISNGFYEHTKSVLPIETVPVELF